MMLEKQAHAHVQLDSKDDQINVHQLLTKIVNELCQMMQSVQRLLVVFNEAPEIYKRQTLASFQQKLSQSLLFQSISNQDKFTAHQNKPRSLNIFRRFSCRVLQLILPFKQRAQSSQTLSPMLKIISKIQSAISVLQQQYNIIQFLQEIKQTFVSFVLQTTKRIFRESPQKNLQSIDSNKNEKLVSLSKDARNRTFQVEYEYQNKLKKLVSGINSRFKTLDCMDLDYNHFRSSFFQANNNSEFFEDYLQKNTLIHNQIRSYSKDYKQYIKKKDRKRLERSIQFNKSKISLSKTFIKEDDNKKQKICSISIGRKISLRTNNWATQRDPNLKYEHKKYSLVEQQNVQVENQSRYKQKNRNKYDIKNIVLTVTKIKPQPFMPIQRVNIKNTLRQLQLCKRKSLKTQEKSILKNLRQISDQFSPLK